MTLPSRPTLVRAVRRYVVQEELSSCAGPSYGNAGHCGCTFNPQWKIRLRSWDRFQIPLPFSRCEMIFEKPLLVPREASESDREAFRLQLEQALKYISRE